jgi:hypothetical protein
LSAFQALLRLSLFNPNSLDVGKFSYTMDAEFPAVTGGLYTAKRHPKILVRHHIDKDCSRIDIPDKESQ